MIYFKHMKKFIIFDSMLSTEIASGFQGAQIGIFSVRNF